MHWACTPGTHMLSHAHTHLYVLLTFGRALDSALKSVLACVIRHAPHACMCVILCSNEYSHVHSHTHTHTHTHTKLLVVLFLSHSVVLYFSGFSFLFLASLMFSVFFLFFNIYLVFLLFFLFLFLFIFSLFLHFFFLFP